MVRSFGRSGTPGPNRVLREPSACGDSGSRQRKRVLDGEPGRIGAYRLDAHACQRMPCPVRRCGFIYAGVVVYPGFEANGPGGRIREATSVRGHVASVVTTPARTGSGRSQKLEEPRSTHEGNPSALPALSPGYSSTKRSPSCLLPARRQPPSHPPTTAAATTTTVTTARPAWQGPSAQSLGNPSVWNFWSSSTNAGCQFGQKEAR